MIYQSQGKAKLKGESTLSIIRNWSRSQSVSLGTPAQCQRAWQWAGFIKGHHTYKRKARLTKRKKAGGPTLLKIPRIVIHYSSFPLHGMWHLLFNKNCTKQNNTREPLIVVWQRFVKLLNFHQLVRFLVGIRDCILANVPVSPQKRSAIYNLNSWLHNSCLHFICIAFW